MRSIPPFSKEYADEPVVHNDEGQRSGFLDHVKMTKCSEPEPRRGLAAFQGQGPDTKPMGNPAHPEFKKRDDDGLRDFPKPFSKTKISGGPKKPHTPA
jgi:hypothetical protein